MTVDKLEKLGNVLKQLVGPDFIDFKITHGEAVLLVYPASIVRILTLLSNHTLCDFKQLIDITAVDYPSRTQRFDIVYHLLSHSCNQRLRLKIAINEGTCPPTVTQVFANANWYEREIWDLFGIVFSDHPDLRRILTDYNFSGHPLRKDFPLTGYTQVRYCEKEKRVLYEPVSLQQDYRQFDFLSPWEGPNATNFLKANMPVNPDLLNAKKP